MPPAKIPEAGSADYRIKQLAALRKCKVQDNVDLNGARIEEGMQTRCSASGYVQLLLPPRPPPQDYSKATKSLAGHELDAYVHASEAIRLAVPPHL